MPTTSPRLSLHSPLGADTVSELRVAIGNHASALDAAVTVASGTLAAIPAAGLAGRRYYATDQGIELWDTGTSWIPTGPALPVGSMALWTINADPIDPDGTVRWMVADGRALAKASVPALNALYSAAGYPHGQSGGNLLLPDSRGRVIAGPDTGIGTGAAGRLHSQTVSGIANQNTVAGTGGSDAYKLVAAESGVNGSGGTANDTPDHGHTYTDPGHNHNAHNPPINPNDAGWGIAALQGGITSVSPFNNNYAGGALAFVDSNTTHITINGATTRHTHPLTARTADTTHNNMAPYLVVHHIVRVL